MMRLTPISTRTDTLVPYTSLFRSGRSRGVVRERVFVRLYKNHNKLLGGHNEIEGKLVPRGVDCDVNGRRRPRLCPTGAIAGRRRRVAGEWGRGDRGHRLPHRPAGTPIADACACYRSEEHTHELQTQLGQSSAVYCLKK